MKEYFRVLSLFDGIAAVREALRRFLPEYYKLIYMASEIDELAIKIAMHNFPDIIQLGDIRDINWNIIPTSVDLITAGSPCQDFSPAGKRRGLVTTTGVEILSLEQYMDLKDKNHQFQGESYLFWDFVRILHEIDHKYFLLENIANMNPKWVNLITNTLEVEPIIINSNLLSGQNRRRRYWTNIPNVTIPEDKGILLSDIIPGAIAGYGIRSGWDPIKKVLLPTKGTTRKDGKSNTLVTKDGYTTMVEMITGEKVRMSLPAWERLQTYPEGYTNVPGIGVMARRHALGNSMTVDVIKHILSFIPELKKELILI